MFTFKRHGNDCTGVAAETNEACSDEMCLKKNFQLKVKSGDELCLSNGKKRVRVRVWI